MKKIIPLLLSALMIAGASATVSADETSTEQSENAINLVEICTPVFGGEVGSNYWQAFDGKINTACAFSDWNSWVGIQLEYPAVFSHVRMAAQDSDGDGIPDRVHALNGTVVEGSNDCENWELILDVDGLDTEDYYWTIEEDGELYYTEYTETEKAYSYFRVYNNGSGAPAWSEIEFYGTPTGSKEEDPTPAAAEKTKDGLTAVLAVTEDGSNPGRGGLSLALTNNSGGCISDVTVEINLPDTLAFDEGEAVQTIAIGEGETAEILAKIRHTDLPAPETEAVETEGTAETDKADEETDAPSDDADDNKGGWILPAAIAAALVVIAVVVLLIARKKKGAAACLILCGILFGSLAVPTSAAAAERSMTLTCYFDYNGESYPIEVTIRYNYSFTEADAKETNGMKQFEITYYGGLWGDNMTDESFIQKIVDAGFTSIPLEWGSPDQLKEALALFRKHGLTCSAIRDPRIEAFIPTGTDGTTTATQEEIDRVVAEVVADYADYMDVIEGWLLKDEPNTSYFDLLSKLIAAFRKYSPDKNTMVNLFPTYAASAVGTETYKEYLDLFVEQCDPHYLSYDHYHFLKGGITRPGFFTNLENVRDKAQETGIDPMIIILVSKHDDYDDLTYAQLQWEVNTSLTYGMKRISYYTCVISAYTEEDLGYSNGFIRYTGELYPHYYDGQKINQWLLPLGRELFDKNSTAVFHLMEKKYQLEEDCTAYEGYGDLGEVKGNEFVIGFFDDCSFMITNKLWIEGEEGKNTLEFIDIKGGLEYFDPTAAAWKDAEADGIVERNESGNLTSTFDAGEGILFRIAPQAK